MHLIRGFSSAITITSTISLLQLLIKLLLLANLNSIYFIIRA